MIGLESAAKESGRVGVGGGGVTGLESARRLQVVPVGDGGGSGSELAAVRQQRILALLDAQEFITVTEAQAAIGASLATARRDLSVLAASGALIRIRGGATRAASPPAVVRPPVFPLSVEPSSRERILVACLVQARRAADRRDLTGVEGALEQALTTCRQLRRDRVSGE